MFRKLLARALPTKQNQSVVPFLLAFCIAAAAVALGFAADALNLRWLGILAFALTAFCVLWGWIFGVLYIWYLLTRGR